MISVLKPMRMDDYPHCAGKICPAHPEGNDEIADFSAKNVIDPVVRISSR
jgi:hypothetical protein